MARSATLASEIQGVLARYYGVEDAPSVDDFIREADGDEREGLVVREVDGELAIEVRLPRGALDRGARLGLDVAAQVVEGVSHFLVLAERARRELPVTQLELELQAEVDKYLMFVHVGPLSARFHAGRAARVRERLYGRVRFLDASGTETGDRYRLANGLAARYADRLEGYAKRGRFADMRAALRRFYGAGQNEKIQLACAA